jgi:hypothetical protein
MTTETEKTLSIPEAGRIYFGLGRGGSYQAAKRGDIPYIEVGRLKRVPVRTMERKLDKVTEESVDGDGGAGLVAPELRHGRGGGAS